MDSLDPPGEVYEAQRVRANRQELAERIARTIADDGRIEPLNGLFLTRFSSPTLPTHGVADRSFCVIAQGSKELLLAAERYRYDPEHYLLTTIELPVVSQIREASPERPYLGVRVQLDPTIVGAVLAETDRLAAGRGDVRAMDASRLDASLLDAVLRLVRLIDTPGAARVLAPLITREIIVRLLLGAQGERLGQLAVRSGYTHQIARAVDLLRKEFAEPLRIEQLAQVLGMSVSGFHHQFKAVTAMSPLQYQKRLRLQEARRLMLGEHLDAASAGYRVGYDDASHFNREYKSLFGLPPLRDIARLRQAANASTLQEVARG